MTKVLRRENETQIQLFRRFRKSVSRSGIMSEVRKRRWYISKNEIRRIEKKKAARRNKLRHRRKKG